MRKALFRTCVALASLCIYSGLAFAQQIPFLQNNSILDSLQNIITSTVPSSNGDTNPYGVAFVPFGFPSGGSIAAGDVLVSNFNNSSSLGSLEGTGTTIVSISPTGQQTLFATSPLSGLTTALGVFSRGFVIVGNLPVSYSPSFSIGQGSLQIFDRNGMLVTTINDATLLDSPWDLTIHDQGSSALVFVSNVLSGTATRLDFAFSTKGVQLVSKTQIGFSTMVIQAIVALGPTGLAYDPERDILFVASTLDNEIFAISDAAKRNKSTGTGTVVFADQTHLHGPLGLTLAPNGNLITANGDAVNFVQGTQNELVEFTEQGAFVATYQIDPGNLGAAFGIATAISQGTVRLAAVDDDQNTLIVWTLRSLL